MLSKNIRSHIVILRDWREFNITREQYWILKISRQDWKRNDPLEIRDCDTQKIIYDWELWDIKEFKEREFVNMSWYVYICSYGTRHNLNDECLCKEKFKCFYWSFYGRLGDRNINIYYSKQITQEMQRNFLTFLNLNKIEWYVHKKQK